MVKVKVSKASCNIGIPKFYNLIARAAGLPVTQDTNYDCRKICVSEKIFEALEDYYLADGATKLDFSMIWMCYGPKVKPELDDFEVELDEGFVFEVDKNLCVES